MWFELRAHPRELSADFFIFLSVEELRTGRGYTLRERVPECTGSELHGLGGHQMSRRSRSTGWFLVICFCEKSTKQNKARKNFKGDKTA